MGQLVGVREEFQIGQDATPIRTGGNPFVFRDALTGETASGLMSVLEWNVTLDKWVQVEAPQGARPGSAQSASINRQLEIVWSQPIGRLRPPARPSGAELTSGVSVLPYVPPQPTPTVTPPRIVSAAPTPVAIESTSAHALLPVPSIDVAAPAEPFPTPAPGSGVVPDFGPSAPVADRETIVDGVTGLAGIPVWVLVVGGIGAIWIFTRK